MRAPRSEAKTPLERTVKELSTLVESIRSDCAHRARVMLDTHSPEAETLNDLARLDEALAKAQESLANVCSALFVRALLRQLNARETSSGNP